MREPITIYEDWNEIDGKIYYRWRIEGEEKWHVKLTAYKEKPVMQYKLLSIKELERLEAKETKQ